MKDCYLKFEVKVTLMMIAYCYPPPPTTYDLRARHRAGVDSCHAQTKSMTSYKVVIGQSIYGHTSHVVSTTAYVMPTGTILGVAVFRRQFRVIFWVEGFILLAEVIVVSCLLQKWWPKLSSPEVVGGGWWSVAVVNHHRVF